MYGLKAVRTRLNWGGNLVQAVPVGGEFTMLPYACYRFHATKNKITYSSRLQPYCTIMEVYNAELV